MPSLDPALLSDARTLAAYLIFVGSYFVFVLGKFPWTKIDREAGRCRAGDDRCGAESQLKSHRSTFAVAICPHPR